MTLLGTLISNRHQRALEKATRWLEHRKETYASLMGAARSIRVAFGAWMEQGGAEPAKRMDLGIKELNHAHEQTVIVGSQSTFEAAQASARLVRGCRHLSAATVLGPSSLPSSLSSRSTTSVDRVGGPKGQGYTGRFVFCGGSRDLVPCRLHPHHAAFVDDRSGQCGAGSSWPSSSPRRPHRSASASMGRRAQRSSRGFLFPCCISMD
jgi:hypothetical protein